MVSIMELPKPRKMTLGRFLGAIQERLVFRENVDRGQNAAFAALVQVLVKRGACSLEEVAAALQAAEEDARRLNEHAATIRQLRRLRTRVEELGSGSSQGDTGANS
jgi:hypothetical protein